MSDTSGPGEVTELLVAWTGGDRSALDTLLPLVERELRRIARRQLAGERVGHSLESSLLINEAYLRLVDQNRVRWQNRAHFFGIAAQAMRRILISRARARRAEKRGGGAARISLEDAGELGTVRAPELLALDAALETLAGLDPRRAKVVELRYFGGLSVEESAEVLGVSSDTVMRDWKRARAWLAEELAPA